MKKTIFTSAIKYSLNSISSRLLALVLITVVPVVCLFIYSNHKSRTILLTQVEDTHKNMLQSYAYQIDLQLERALADTVGLTINEADVQTITFNQDGYSAQYAKVRLKSKLEELLLTNNYISGYFMKVPEANGYENFFYTQRWQYTALNQDALQKYISNSITNHLPQNQWQFCTINEQHYLFLLTGGTDGVYAGAYVKLDALLDLFSPSSSPNSQLYLLSPGQNDDTKNQLSTQTMFVAQSLTNAELFIAESFQRHDILEAFPFMQRYTPVISALLIIMVLFFIVAIHQIVVRPLLGLTEAMHQIQSGNLDYRIFQPHSTTEMNLLNETFNHMAAQIQTLKINIYEQQLKEQKSQLRNLQLQIKPHFLINALNLVYNLIETNKYTPAKHLIQHSVNFFRYMVKVDADLVPLNEEVSHVESFLGIQSLRYEGQFTYKITIDSMIADVLVPPVILQTFVENSMKYALNLTDVLHIDIIVTCFEKDYFPYAKLVIQDNGIGYPAEYLPLINEGKRIIKKDGIHIGIHNTLQRLFIIFGEKTNWRIYNHNGAITEIIIPATFNENEDPTIQSSELL